VLRGLRSRPQPLAGRLDFRHRHKPVGEQPIEVVGDLATPPGGSEIVSLRPHGMGEGYRSRDEAVGRGRGVMRRCMQEFLLLFAKRSALLSSLPGRG
jgi:hypothetical protein